MKKLSEVLTRYGIITAACALYAVGFNWCFDPNRISVGGFTGIAQIINHYLPQLPIGTLALVMNIPLFILGWKKIGKALLFSSLYATAVSSVMIDALAAVHTFQPMDPILACLYGVIALYVSSLLMDKVVYGPNAAKMAYIISERSEEITQKLLDLDRGVTLLDGHGAWSGRRKDVILCAFGRSHIVPIKKLVQEIDPDAFVIVCDAHEILGEGFGTYTPGGL